MKKALILPICIAVLLINASQAQNTFPANGSVGIGTVSPNASSLLEMISTSKGFLMPRMTLAQRNGIAGPATGLMIYQTNSTPGFYYYTGGGWKAITPKAGWLLGGNASTDSSLNFVGTTDAHPLAFRVNNKKAGWIDHDSLLANTGFGYQSLFSNTTGTYNTAIGLFSLFTNSTGSHNTANGSHALRYNTTGQGNTANGSHALYFNTTGNFNVANGSYSLYYNTTGNYNTAYGTSALLYNTTGIHNTANGIFALYLSTTGNNNTANGSQALNSNTTGSNNTANGFKALFNNTTGNDNTAAGLQALYSNTTGFYNTASGENALSNNTIGAYNTAMGLLADVNSGGYNYSSAFGVGATITGSNQIRIGSVGSAVGYDPVSIGGKVGWSTLSDGRVKKNIKSNVPGLAFINKLDPITYNIDANAVDNIVQRPLIKDRDGKAIQPSLEEPASASANKAIVYTGFVAQDVEKAAKSLNYEFSGVDAAKNDKDLYGLRYSDFVVPLVKAVQELSKMNDEKDAKIGALEARLSKLEELLKIKTSNVSFKEASIEQNVPNPFTNETTIGYTLPQKFTNAQIVITDITGKALSTTRLSGTGQGMLKVNASTLASGAYQYSLIIDGRLIDTKQMILAR